MSLCQHLVEATHTDFICTLASAHAGDHDFIDAMGVCREHVDCRASQAPAFRTTRENTIEHDPRCPARHTT